MSLGIFRWLSQSLAISFKQRSRSEFSQSDLGSFTLPSELILIINSYLDDTSTICLSLSCRFLHGLLSSRSSVQDTAQKERLLLLLEKDIPNLFYCHGCNRLHTWNKRWGNPLQIRFEDRSPCFPENLLDPFSISSFWSIPYHYARLFMNQHRYGTVHGLPLQKLERQIPWHLHPRYPVNGVKLSEHIRARILDNKLMLLLEMTIFQPQGDLKSLKYFIDSRQVLKLVCNHLMLSEGLDYVCPTQLPELARGAAGHLIPCKPSYGSCPRCMTDYGIEILWDSYKKGHAIKLSAYYSLGDCRSPFDWGWSTIARLGPHDDPRCLYPVECRPGIVRDIWNEADGIFEETPSKWVELPRFLPRDLDRALRESQKESE